MGQPSPRGLPYPWCGNTQPRAMGGLVDKATLAAAAQAWSVSVLKEACGSNSFAPAVIDVHIASLTVPVPQLLRSGFVFASSSPSNSTLAKKKRSFNSGVKIQF